jgi:hypothetical protein
MQYMLLIYTAPGTYESMPGDERALVHKDYGEYTTGIVESKEFLSGAPLSGIDTATTVTVQNGRRLTTDGPFAETKEVLGGYYLVDVADLDRALELAAQLPGVVRGFDKCEVRPVADMPD